MGMDIDRSNADFDGEPLENRVVVLEDPIPEEEVRGGIIIQRSREAEPSVRGTVVAVGRGNWSETLGDFVQCQLEPGDAVMFGKFVGTKIKLMGREYLIMRESDILLRLT